MEFRKKYTINLKDYTDFNFYHNKNRLIFGPATTLFIIPLIWLILGFIYYGLNWGLIFDHLYPAYWLFLLAPLLALINIIQLKVRSKNQYNSSGQMKAENELVIDGNGVRESNEYGNISAPWKDIYKASESKKAVYIYVSRSQVVILPKRYLNASEMETLRSLIKANIDPKKYRLPEGAPGEY